jgi:hypothetical protein
LSKKKKSYCTSDLIAGTDSSFPNFYYDISNQNLCAWFLHIPSCVSNYTSSGCQITGEEKVLPDLPDLPEPAWM